MDLQKITEDMLSALKPIAKDHLDEIRDIADDELADFAKRSFELAKKVKEGKLNESQARAILKIRQNAVETVLLSIAGIGLIAAEEAINAIIGVLTGVLKEAVPGVNLFI